MGGLVATQMGAPLTAATCPPRSRPSRLATIDGTEASSGSSKRLGVGAHRTPSPPARSWARSDHARYAACAAFALIPRPSIASRCWCGTISPVSRGVRDPIDRISSADPFADHGIPSFAQPGERRSRRCEPSRCFGQVEDGRAVRPLQQIDDLRPIAAFSWMAT